MSSYLLPTLGILQLAGFCGGAPAQGPLHAVPHESVELRAPFWGPRLKAHHEVTIPHSLDRLEQAGHVTNFDKAAGVFDGPLRGHHAFDSDLHKALEGALYSLQHNDDSGLRRRVEGILDGVLAAQQKDGFLISCYIVKREFWRPKSLYRVDDWCRRTVCITEKYTR